MRTSSHVMSEDEASSVKEQLRESQGDLEKMQPAAQVNSRGRNKRSQSQIRADLVSEFKSIGYKVDRQGFGVILLGEAEINSSLNYLKDDAEIAAYQVTPRVLKRGIVIDGHNKHKGRLYDTITIAAPITLNGARANMAVVVKKTKGNRYKVHRVLSPDGTPFILPDMANAEPRTGRHVTGGANSPGVIERPINSASTPFIAEAEQDVNSPAVRKSSGNNLDADSNAVKDHERAALDYFGRTYSWKETGYLTASGKKLDFSRRTPEGKAVGEAINAQNVQLREDVKQRGKLRRVLEDSQSGKVSQRLAQTAAGVVMEEAGVSGAKKELGGLLYDFYSYIRSGEDLSLEGITLAAEPGG